MSKIALKGFSYAKAVRAKCKECMNNYADGKVDCQIEDCALYPFMPFNSKNKAKRLAKRTKTGIPGTIPDGLRAWREAKKSKPI